MVFEPLAHLVRVGIDTPILKMRKQSQEMTYLRPRVWLSREPGPQSRSSLLSLPPTVLQMEGGPRLETTSSQGSSLGPFHHQTHTLATSDH